MRRLFTLLLLLESAWLGAQIPCNGQFLTSGSAVNQGACIQLTPNATGQQGCAWLNTPVDFSQPFTHSMTANFGNLDANGADGICLVYQPNGPNVCGDVGQGIGAQGIPNSFIVEFDTWDNGAASGDIPPDHCAVNLNGNMSAPINGPVSLGNIEDGANHTISFSWNPVGNSYSVTFDGAPVLSGTYDIINLIFGGNNLAYWGYTSSTGAATNTQVICPGLPPQIVVDAGPTTDIPCVGTQIMLDGTGSDTGPDFVYSWSTLGGHIVSGGNTLTPIVDAPGTYILTLSNISNGCQETDEVTVTLTPLQAIIAPPPFISCNQPTFFLNGSASSSGPFISYQWTTLDGMIVSGANSPIVEIASEGTYTLTVTYNNGGNICTEQATVQVMPNPNVPVANATDGLVDCYFPVTQLSGVGSSTGAAYAYQWTSPTGAILFGSTTLFPTVGAPGIYTLTVTNINTGCTDEISVVVDGGFDQPDIGATVDGMLGCQTPQVTIDALASSQGPEFVYAWSTPNGNIISGETTLTPVVDTPGSYTLTVTNLLNGCVESTTVVVDEGATSLIVDAQAPLGLSCTTTQVALDGTNSDQGQYYEYLWSTANGNIVSGANTLSPTVDEPGVYTLTVLNTEDGCTGVDSVTVVQNINYPLAEAGSPQELSCGDASLTLDGTGSAQGDAITYQWSSATGNIVSGATGLTPLINAPGAYFLAVTNALNGCVSVDSVLVSSDANAPLLVLLANDTLDCSTQEVGINAGGSVLGPNFDYQWTTANGHFVSTQDSLLVIVDAPGQYSLAITDLSNNCVATSTVTVIQDVQAPLAVAAPADTLDCGITTLILDGSASSQGPLYAYQWTTTNGNILSGGQSLSPQANAPGLYQLQVTNLQNTCSSTASVIVYQDTLSPNVQIAAPDILNCLTAEISLDAGGSSQGSPYSLLWTTNGGNFTGNTTSLTPTANAPGIYTLQVTNTQNACVQEASVLVQQDTLHPLADAGAGQVLNCTAPNLQLDGELSSQGAAYSYQWAGTGGQPLSGANTLTPTVDQPGTYQLVVENTVNGCTDMDMVIVSSDFEEPVVDIAPPGFLTCTNSSVTIDGASSSAGPNFQYLWSSPDGSILSGALSPQATVSQAGTYILEVLNVDNGCATTDSVQVDQDVNVPMVQVAPSLPITCSRLTVTLDGSGSSQGNAYSVQWSTSDGNILSGSQSLMPEVDAPGTYILQVLSLVNDCEVMASVQVMIDTVAPAVDAGPAQVLSCLAPSLSLDGSGSAQGSQYSYQWMTTDGNILSGADGLSPLIDAPGAYTLLTVNSENGCSQSASVQVGEDFEAPNIEIASPELLTCIRESVALDASTSDSAPYLSYQWATQDGQIQSGGSSLLATAGAPGSYSLAIYNQNNGCSDTMAVNVLQDITSPTASIALPELLTCAVETVQLDGSSSSTGANYLYQWTTQDGSITGGADSVLPTVDAPGQYILAVTNEENGCQDSATVAVLQDIVLPEVAIAPPDVLSCVVTEVSLEGAATGSGTDFTYQWSTTDGNILSGSQSLTPGVDAPGMYLLQAISLANGCEGMASVQVLIDTIAPVVDAGPAQVLSCLTPSLSLNGSGSAQGSQYSYQWMTTDGNILSGADGLSPLIDAQGTYTLLSTNAENGCTQAASVQVSEDFAIPAIEIATPELLTCTRESVALDASSSDSAPYFTYQWATQDGQITGGGNSLLATAAAPGSYSLAIYNQNNGCSDTMAVTILQDILLPTVSIASPERLTCAVETIQLDGTGSSAGGAYLYQWTTQDGSITGGADSALPTVDAPGQYILAVTNEENGCQDSAAVAVVQDIVLPAVAIVPPDILTCAETTIGLDATASSSGPVFFYQWSTANGAILGSVNNSEAVASAPGIYTLSILNQDNGCSDSLSIQVQQDITPPVVDITPPAVLTCSVEELTLDASASSAGPSFQYQWETTDGMLSGGADSPAPMVSAPGTYLLTILNQDNGCSETAEVMVQQDIAPPTAAIAGPDTLTCVVESIILDGSSSSAGGIFQYQWQSTDGHIVAGGNTPQPTADAPGQYTLIILNTENGCSDTASTNVQQDIAIPVANIAPPEILTCAVQEVTLDGSISSNGNIFQYQWTTQGGNITAGANSLTPVANAPGLYVLRITNTDNGCEQEASITLNQDIQPPVANAGGDFILPCFEDQRQLNGAGSSQGATFSYQWTAINGNLVSGNTSLNPLIDAPGVYRLLVSNTINGCVSDDEVVVGQDFPSAMVSAVQPLCYGDRGIILVESVNGGSPPYLFSVNGGDSFQSNPIFQQAPSGLYEVVVQDVNGCEYRQQQLIEQPDSLIVLAAEPEATVLLGDTYQINTLVNIPYSELAWVSWGGRSDLSCDDCLDPIASPGESTDYRVRVRSVNGCEDVAVVRVYVDKRPNIFIPNAFSPNGDGANDVFLIFARSGSVAQVRSFYIFNRWGEQVFQAFGFPPNDPRYGWDGIFRGEPMNPAVFSYFAEIEFVDGSVELFKGDVQLVK
ncbi:MAG: gliding motility-associated C-terminal domain-containing protein [Lewinellaceae bacterium]|nr:gliding motility-associated C-terminal domain-containing protein [Lewinellaceae bacterium]